MTTARHVTITGRVQGVNFRRWTQDQARALGLTGWVRNQPDGSVRVFVSGPEAAVEQLLKVLRHGPDGARVDRLDHTPAEPQPCIGFAVRRD